MLARITRTTYVCWPAISTEIPNLKKKKKVVQMQLQPPELGKLLNTEADWMIIPGAVPQDEIPPTV